MKSAVVIALLMGVVLSFATVNHAQEPRWKLPSLNLFKFRAKDKKEGRGRARISDQRNSGLRPPQLPKLPTLPTLDRRSPAQPSRGRKTVAKPTSWQKLNHGTRDFFSKTKDVLMPWGKPEPPKPPSQMRTARQPKTAKKSIFSSWLPQQEEPKRINSVNEFLKLPRVEP